MLIINFKTYKSGNLKLVKKISKISKKIIIAVQPTDIYLFSRFGNPIFAQHADYFDVGRNTGFITVEAVKRNKASGCMLNHSEHRLKFDILKKTVNKCKRLKLKVLVCVSSLNEAKKVKKLKPSMMAYEPKELIATGKSVSKAKPTIVKKFSDLLKNTRIIPLCGAGIINKEDVLTARKLGCKGVLVSSAVMKAINTEKVLRELNA